MWLHFIVWHLLWDKHKNIMRCRCPKGQFDQGMLLWWKSQIIFCLSHGLSVTRQDMLEMGQSKMGITTFCKCHPHQHTLRTKSTPKNLVWFFSLSQIGNLCQYLEVPQLNLDVIAVVLPGTHFGTSRYWHKSPILTSWNTKKGTLKHFLSS